MANLTINTTDNKFHYKPSGVGNANLDTVGKFLDRDIVVEDTAASLGSQSTTTNSVSPSGTATGFTPSTTATDYYVTPKATSSWAASKTVTAGGFIAKDTKVSVSGGVSTATEGNKVYIPKGAVSVAERTIAPGAVTIANQTSGFPTTIKGQRLDIEPTTTVPSVATNPYIAIKATAAAASSSGQSSDITIGTAGYVKDASDVSIGALKTSSKSSSMYYIPLVASVAQNPVTTTSTSGSVTVTPSNSYQSVAITKGYVNSTNRTVVVKPISEGPKSTIGVLSKTATAAEKNAFTDNTTAVVPEGGYLTLSAGYMPATKIALSTLVPDDANIGTSGYGADTILTGTTAYDKDGNKVVGSMANLSANDLQFSDSSSVGLTDIQRIPADEIQFNFKGTIKLSSSKTGYIASGTSSSAKTVTFASTMPAAVMTGALHQTGDSAYPTGYDYYRVYPSTNGYADRYSSLNVAVYQGSYTTT